MNGSYTLAVSQNRQYFVRGGKGKTLGSEDSSRVLGLPLVRLADFGKVTEPSWGRRYRLALIWTPKTSLTESV